MDLFMTIHDRKEDRDIDLEMTTLESYKEADIIDIDKLTHKCIVYIMRNGLRIEEEFSSDADRQARMDMLDMYLA